MERRGRVDPSDSFIVSSERETARRPHLELVSENRHDCAMDFFIWCSSALLFALAIEMSIIEVDDLLIDHVGCEDPNRLGTVHSLIDTPAVRTTTWPVLARDTEGQ